jgi:hypothetical protein
LINFEDETVNQFGEYNLWPIQNEDTRINQLTCKKLVLDPVPANKLIGKDRPL